MRLIDADPLIDECAECMSIYWDKKVRVPWAYAEEDFQERLRDAPTIDAVPVVRCKDCRWHPHYGEEQDMFYLYYGLYSCPMWDNGDDGLGAHWNGHDEGFCDAGERRME